jgi:hypothetical protein
MQQGRFEPQERDDLWPEASFHRPLRPVLEVRLEVEADEAIAQRPWHGEVHATLGGRIAGCDHHPIVREVVFTELAVEHQLTAARLGHLRRGSPLVEKEDAPAGGRQKFRGQPFRLICGYAAATRADHPSS